jgi:RNA polymerase sigma factor (sigma-70 family)
MDFPCQDRFGPGKTLRMPATESDDPWARALIEQNQRWLTAYFLTATGDRSTADDLAQEVFKEALQSQHTYDRSKPFGAWLRGIARHLLFRHYRNARHALLPLDGQLIDRLDLHASEAEDRQIDPDWQPTRIATLRGCLELLTARVRGILTLKYEQRLPSKEIAEHFDMKINAVDMAMSRARRVLEDCVERRLGRALGE